MVTLTSHKCYHRNSPPVFHIEFQTLLSVPVVEIDTYKQFMKWLMQCISDPDGY